MVWLIITFNSALFVYLIARLTDASISPLGVELIAVGALIVLTLIILQIRNLPGKAQSIKATLVSR